MRWIRLAFVAVCLVALAVAISRVRLPTSGLDSARGLARRAEALDSRLEAFQRMQRAKAEIADDIAAGRMNLREAGREFDRLHRMLDDGYDDVLGPVLLPRGEEELCRNVIDWTGNFLQNQPGRAAAVLPRLEEEFRRDFARS